jgi:hypothetical protein
MCYILQVRGGLVPDASFTLVVSVSRFDLGVDTIIAQISLYHILLLKLNFSLSMLWDHNRVIIKCRKPARIAQSSHTMISAICAKESFTG